jgi:phosphoglycerate dehydrogenase-like enzyme
MRPIALEGRTMLVVGLGGIGSEVAERAHGFGMRVIATRRSDAASPSWIAHVGKPGELLAMLPEADVVAICVPLTAETEHLFDKKAFAAMKPGSYLVNVAGRSSTRRRCSTRSRRNTSPARASTSPTPSRCLPTTRSGSSRTS